MNELKLNIERDDEITLPVALIDGALTLPELGALFIWACIADGRAPLEHWRIGEADMIEPLKKLKERGVFTIKVQDGRVKIGVDLDQAIGEPEAPATK